MLNIDSSGTITINGDPAIRANGGSDYAANWTTGGGGSGSGGAIRVIAPTIAGSGTLSAQPGSAIGYGGGTGGNGRIRLEATTFSFTGSTTPLTVRRIRSPQLTAAPQSGNRTTASCALLDGSQGSASYTASISISLPQTNILTASAVFPLVASAGEGSIYAEDEEVKWVRVASTLGGTSAVTYITATGKEVPATALASRAP